MSRTRVNKKGEIDGASTSEDYSYDELLPGILNDITLEVITPMLSWSDLLARFEASPVWQQAIRDQQVYDARVRSHKTEKLFVVHFSKVVKKLVEDTRFEDVFRLYSASESWWYALPPIPNFGTAILSHFQSVSLNSSIYVFGVTKDALVETSSSKLYVLDLARLQPWRECASMKEVRTDFAVGVMNGKIFAFGGVSDGSATGRCEVYDPEVDAWSRIEPMTPWMHFLPRSPKVIAVGKELFVYSVTWSGDPHWRHVMDSLEVYSDRTSDADEENQRVDLSELANVFMNNLGKLDEGIERQKIWDRVKGAHFVKAYDPVKGTWRAVDRLEMDSFDPARLPEPKHYFKIGNDIVVATTGTMRL